MSTPAVLPAVTSQGKIISFEDNPKDYESFIRPLTSFGWVVEWVADRTVARRKLRDLEYDVVLMDRMWINEYTSRQEWLGDDWLIDISYQTAFPAVVVVSNYPESAAITSAMRHGVYEFLQKGRQGTYPTFEDRLHHICIEAKRTQQFRRIRRSLLERPFAALLKNVYVHLKDSFDDAPVGGPRRPPDVYYLDVLPDSRARVVEMVAGQEELARARPPAQPGRWRHGEALSPDGLPPLARLLQSNRPVYDCRSDGGVLGGSLGEGVRSRLLVPVLMNPHPDARALTPVGLLWLESTDPAGVTMPDTFLARQVAECLADRLTFERSLDNYGRRQQRLGQDVLLSDVARRICSPLQAAQTRIDLLQTRLDRGDAIEPQQLLDTVGRISDDLEQAVQQSDRLRDQVLPPARPRQPIALGRLATDLARYLGGDPVPVAVPADEPTVTVDPSGVRAAVNSLLRQAGTGADAAGEVTFDPVGRKAVAFRVRYRPAAPLDPARLFERTPDQPDGLWAVAEFARDHDGEARGRTTPDGLAELELYLPAD